MTEAEYAQARSEICHLQSIYNTSGDRAKIADLVAVFMEDGVLEVPGTSYHGRDAIAAFLSGISETGASKVDLRGSRHHLTTRRIEFDNPDTALGWTYFFVMRAGVVIQEGTYIDRYSRTASGWRLSHRRVKLLWTLGD